MKQGTADLRAQRETGRAAAALPQLLHTPGQHSLPLGPDSRGGHRDVLSNQNRNLRTGVTHSSVKTDLTKALPKILHNILTQSTAVALNLWVMTWGRGANNPFTEVA